MLAVLPDKRCEVDDPSIYAVALEASVHPRLHLQQTLNLMKEVT
jgi:hypothetical protein